MTAKRYDFSYRNDFQDVLSADRDESDEGEYVAYDDHMVEVAALREALAELVAMVEAEAGKFPTSDLPKLWRARALLAGDKP